MKQYDLYGCPMHLGVGNNGIVSAIKVLQSAFPALCIKKIDEVMMPEDNLPNLKNLNSVVATCNKIASATEKSVKRGNIPVVIGGDHALAMGSISGVCKQRQNLGLFWVDSHSDINTDKTTMTGNIHGMPVSAMLNLGEQKLCNIHFCGEKILPQNVVLFGLRDVDPPELEIIRHLGIKSFTCEEIDHRGLLSCLIEAKSHLKSCNGVHLSFDLDSIDPKIIKGVSVPVPGGFTAQEAQDIMEFSLKHINPTSIDIVEFNPSLDQDGFTLTFLGKLINMILKNN